MFTGAQTDLASLPINDLHSKHNLVLLVEAEQDLTSHQTHYRSYWGPNQQCQSTEGR